MGTVSIDGTPQVGSRLSANTASITDATGTVEYVRKTLTAPATPTPTDAQMSAGDTVSSDAVYYPVSTDAGKWIAVIVSYSNNSGEKISPAVRIADADSQAPGASGSVNITDGDGADPVLQVGRYLTGKYRPRHRRNTRHPHRIQVGTHRWNTRNRHRGVNRRPNLYSCYGG